MSMSNNMKDNMLNSLNALGAKITKEDVDTKSGLNALNLIASAVTQLDCNEKSINDALRFMADNYKGTGGGVEDVTELPKVGESGKIYRLTAIRPPKYSTSIGTWYIPKSKPFYAGAIYVDENYGRIFSGKESSLLSNIKLGSITTSQNSPAWEFSSSSGTRYNFIGSLQDSYWILNRVYPTINKSLSNTEFTKIKEFGIKVAAPCCYDLSDGTPVPLDKAKEIGYYKWNETTQEYDNIGVESSPQFKHTISFNDADMPSFYFYDNNPYAYIPSLSTVSEYSIPNGISVYNDDIKNITVEGTSYQIMSMDYGKIGSSIAYLRIYYLAGVGKVEFIRKYLAGADNSYDTVSIVEE